MTRKQKHLLARIVIAAILFFAGSLFYLPEYMEAGIFLICYIVVGWDIVWKAITNILHGQVFDENFLMTIATIGALVLGEHSEGVAVMLFYQVGEWFQSYAVSKSRKSIASLMDIRPDYANVQRNGELIQVDPDEVQIGDTIIVKPGERISFFGGIGGASKIGVLVKGSNYLESLAHAEYVVFDKTGTLTKGSFAVSEIHPNGIKDIQLLELAAYAEDYSNHPISLSIKKAYGKEINHNRIGDIQEVAGHGVRTVIDNNTVLAGNAKLMKRENIRYINRTM